MPHHAHPIDRWDDTTGSNLYEHLAGLTRDWWESPPQVHRLEPWWRGCPTFSTTCWLLWVEGDHLRAAPVLVRHRYPAFGELHELVSDGHIVGQTCKPYAFACAAHTFLFVRPELRAV
jgi:hypothetical protein